MTNKDVLKAVLEAVEKKEKSASLFVGRFQPFHIGHAEAVKKMSFTPVICIIKGKQSSEDKTQNPLDEDYQAKLIKKTFPNARIIIADKAFIPAIIGQVREQFGLEVKELLGGKDPAKNEDRLASYKKQIESANKAAAKAAEDPEKEQYPQIKIELYTETPRITSASRVRAAIREGNKTEFLKLMPAQLHAEWPMMRDIFMDIKESAFVFNKILLEESEQLVTMFFDKDKKIYVYKLSDGTFEVEQNGQKKKIPGVFKLKELISNLVDELGLKPGYSYK